MQSFSTSKTVLHLILHICVPVLLVLSMAGTARAELLREACDRPVNAELARALSDGRDADFLRSLEVLADNLDEIRDSVPADAYDPIAVLTATDLDPVSVNDWVGANITLLPYIGMLRGPKGVLLDRHGNSLDRALFLADLLSFAGYDIRLARRQLDPIAAQTLSAEVGILPGRPRERDTNLDLAATARGLGLAPQTLDDIALELAANDRRCREAITARIDEQSRALLDLVGDTGPSLPGRAAILADHWWVQADTGAGWDDFDPSARIIGQQEPSEVMPVDAVPRALQHRVTIRLMAEFLGTNGAKSETILEHGASAADLALKRIYLQGEPAFSPDPPANPASPLRAAIVARASSEVWLPVLSVGGERLIGKILSLEGGARTATARAIDELVEGGPSALSARAGGLLGGGLTGGGARSEAEPTPLSAYWLEIDVAVPGQAVRTHKRSLYDAFGPAVRAQGLPDAAGDRIDVAARGLALLSQTEIGVAVAAPTAEAAIFQEAEAAAQMLRALADIFNGKEPRAIDRMSNALWMASQRASYLPLPDSVHVAPSVTLVHNEFRSDGANQFAYAATTDIVENAVVDATLPFETHLRTGVADTVLETFPANADDIPDNTSDLFSLYPDDWVVLGKGQTADLASLYLTDDTKARAAEDLKRGYLLVAPTQNFAALNQTYWRIDPETGNTLGIGALGRGAESAEYSLSSELWIGVKAVWQFHPLAICAILNGTGDLDRAGTERCFTGALMLTGTGIALKSLPSAGIILSERSRNIAHLVKYIAEFYWVNSQVREKFEDFLKRQRDEFLYARR